MVLAPERYRELVRDGLPDFYGKLSDFVKGNRGYLSEEEVAFFEALKRDDPVPPSSEEYATKEEINELIFIYSPDDMTAKESEAWLSGLLTKYAFDQAMSLNCRPDQYLFPTKENLNWAIRKYEQERFFSMKPWDREKCVIEAWNERNHRLAERGMRVYNYPAYWKGNGGTHERVGDYDQKERARLWRRWGIENGLRKIVEQKVSQKPEPVNDQSLKNAKQDPPAKPKTQEVNVIVKPKPKPNPVDDVSWL